MSRISLDIPGGYQVGTKFDGIGDSGFELWLAARILYSLSEETWEDFDEVFGPGISGRFTFLTAGKMRSVGRRCHFTLALRRREKIPR
jgi:hypothetical protein